MPTNDIALIMLRRQLIVFRLIAAVRRGAYQLGEALVQSDEFVVEGRDAHLILYLSVCILFDLFVDYILTLLFLHWRLIFVYGGSTIRCLLLSIIHIRIIVIVMTISAVV